MLLMPKGPEKLVLAEIYTIYLHSSYTAKIYGDICILMSNLQNNYSLSDCLFCQDAGYGKGGAGRVGKRACVFRFPTTSAAAD
jgi:hypothetical protein